MLGISAEDRFGEINFLDIFGGLVFDFCRGLFDRDFRHRPAGPRHGENIEITLDHIVQCVP